MKLLTKELKEEFAKQGDTSILIQIPGIEDVERARKMIAEKIADAVVKKQKGDSEAITIAAEADARATEMKAKAESTRISMTGKAESEAILAKGKSNAESYKLAVDAMGKENFTSYKMTEEIGKSGIKLMPDVLIGGGANGGGGTALEGLLGLQLLGQMGKTIGQNDSHVVEDTKSEILPDDDKKKK